MSPRCVKHDERHRDRRVGSCDGRMSTDCELLSMKRFILWSVIGGGLAACNVPTQPAVTPPSASKPVEIMMAIGGWTAVASLTTGRYYLGSVADAAGLIYAIGGHDGAGGVAGTGGAASIGGRRSEL